MDDVIYGVIDVSMGDGSAGGVSSGDFVPVLPTAPDIAGEFPVWYSPAPLDSVSGEAVPADGEAGTEALQLLRSIDVRLECIFYVSFALLIVLGILLGVELIKGFWVGRG